MCHPERTRGLVVSLRTSDEILQAPARSDVRGVHAWLKAGRVIRNGRQGITIVAPVMSDDDGGKVGTIKPAYEFDVTQAHERTKRAAA
jgi:hypothetical protein